MPRSKGAARRTPGDHGPLTAAGATHAHESSTDRQPAAAAGPLPRPPLEGVVGLAGGGPQPSRTGGALGMAARKSIPVYYSRSSSEGSGSSEAGCRHSGSSGAGGAGSGSDDEGSEAAAISDEELPPLQRLALDGVVRMGGPRLGDPGYSPMRPPLLGMTARKSVGAPPPGVLGMAARKARPRRPPLPQQRQRQQLPQQQRRQRRQRRQRQRGGGRSGGRQEPGGMPREHAAVRRVRAVQAVPHACGPAAARGDQAPTRVESGRPLLQARGVRGPVLRLTPGGC